MGTRTKKGLNRTTQSKRLNIDRWVGIVGLVLTFASILYGVFIQWPQSRELAQIKKDFPIVQLYYETIYLGKLIPLPQDPTRNLNYMTLIDFSDENPGSFQYPRFILRLNTDLHMYLAVDSDSSTAQVAFTIDELRMKRGKMFWRLYPPNQPFPPGNWINPLKD